jgi:DNA-binding phage protein
MEVQKKFFPKILSDNDQAYFDHLLGIIDSVDELSSLQITKSSSSYDFRLAPSVPRYTKMLLEEILKFHNMFNIRLDMSKSIKTSGVIMFKINL